MGHEFFGTFSSQEATLQPNYWLMGLAAAPTFLVAVLELAVAILAFTDGRLTSSARYYWALIIVIAPMIGALAYLIVRGKERLCQHRMRRSIQESYARSSKRRRNLTFRIIVNEVRRERRGRAKHGHTGFFMPNVLQALERLHGITNA